MNNETMEPETRKSGAAPLDSEGRDLQNVEAQQGMERFRVPERVRYGDNSCLCCGRQYKVYAPEDVSESGDYPRGYYQLCNRCFVRQYVQATPEGRSEVQNMLAEIIPHAYQQAEFNTLDVSRPGGRQLATARDTVAGWAQDIVNDNRRSLFLYSEPGSYGSGCGNGKTFLAWAAFKFLARRIAQLEMYPYVDSLKLPFVFLDVRALVNTFKRKRAECCPGDQPQFRFPVHSNGFRMYAFDDYVERLANLPVLIVDDVGQGDLGGMLGETSERLVDLRAQSCLPTLYTSNYGSDDLHRRLGNRAASRVLRGDCTIVELRAPDYWLARNSSGAAP